jgi:hypothetical protein
MIQTFARFAMDSQNEEAPFQVGQLSESLNEAVDTNFRALLDQSITDHPMCTLALAGKAGFVLGAL